MDPIDPKADYSVDDLLQIIGQWIAEIQAEEVAFEENCAVHAPDDGLTTDQRAMAALERPERFPGEHDVAKAWLRTSRTSLHFSLRGTRHGGIHL